MDRSRGRGTERDRALLELFDDLEQQADGLHLVERELEVADLAATEYAAVDLQARLRGAVGHEVEARLLGGQQPRGLLTRVGAGWMVLSAGATARWLVAVDRVLSVAGLGRGAAHPSTRSVADSLPLRALVRRLADEHTAASATLHLVDGSRVDGRLGRVGADFVEVVAGAAHGTVVPLRALSAVRWSA